MSQIPSECWGNPREVGSLGLDWPTQNLAAMDANKSASVDEYLAQVESPLARDFLSQLRAIIQSEVPEAMETISYGIPTYKFNGSIVCFGAFKNHCSFFPGSTVAEFTEELKGYKISKGTIQFRHGDDLPQALIRAILRTRFGDRHETNSSDQTT